MAKRLTAKTQEIKPTLPPSAAKFADTVTIKPEKEAPTPQKGTLYAVFSVKDSTNYETELFTRLIGDTLKQSYYLSENASPIQALESAISDVKENVLRLKETEETIPEFNLVAAALWTNVFYVVRNGAGKVHVVRDGNFKEIEMVEEGKFAVATGVVKKDDVVVLSTQEFADKFPPKKLLRLSPEELKNLAEEESCLMIKFDIEEGAPEETEEFGLTSTKKTPEEKMKNIKETAKEFIGGIKSKIPTKKGKEDENQKAGESGITDLGVKNRQLPKKKLLTGIIGLVVLMGMVFIVRGFIQKSKHKKNEDTNTNIEGVNSARKPDADSPENDLVEQKPEIINSSVFYDLKITNQEADPQYLEFVNENIYAAEKSGNLYVSTTQTPKFEKATEQLFRGLKSIESKDGKIYIAHEKGYSVFDPDKPENITNYETESAEVFFPYLSSIYQIKGKKIVKYTPENEATEGTWAQNADFMEARDMAISVSIYLLTAKGTPVRYTSGIKESFEVTGNSTEIADPVALKTKWDLDNIYIADRGTNSVFVLTKEGEFVKRVEDSRWLDLRDIAIPLEENKIYVLSGSKVYEAEL